MSGTFEIRAGVQLWFEGELVEIREITGDLIVLQSSATLRTLPIRAVVQSATPLGSEEAPPTTATPSNIALSRLPKAQRDALAAKSAAVARVLERCEQKNQSVLRACKELAEPLGVSARTLQRWTAAFERAGEAGFVDARFIAPTRSSVDERWDEACREILRDYVATSTPTIDAVIHLTNRAVIAEYGDAVKIPSRTTAWRRVKELSQGRHSFGSARARRSVAERPDGPFGRLHATRPGEYVVLDTTPLDVFAMQAGTGEWLGVELTVAQDLYTRCILGLRLTPVTSTSADVANVLFQCVTTDIDVDSEETWPFHGVPSTVLITPTDDAVKDATALPACLPEEIVIDHGRAFLSAHVLSACAKLGINVQPARPHRPTDKPTVERFFRTLREGLLQHLPGYKGPDVFNRGINIEQQSFYFIDELEQIIRTWVGTIYHRTPHAGLVLPEANGLPLSPLDMYAIGLAKNHGIHIPTDPQLPFAFLEVFRRKIHHYGVEVDRRRYDGPVLARFRDQRAPRGGWPILIDRHDIRRAWFYDHETCTHEPLTWEHAAAVDQPFSHEAAEYAKRYALEHDRFAEPHQAVHDLLQRWSTEERITRKDRSTARRIATRHQRRTTTPTTPDTHEPPAIHELVDLAQRRIAKHTEAQQADVDEMFAAYLRDHDAIGIEE